MNYEWWMMNYFAFLWLHRTYFSFGNKKKNGFSFYFSHLFRNSGRKSKPFVNKGSSEDWEKSGLRIRDLSNFLILLWFAYQRTPDAEPPACFNDSLSAAKVQRKCERTKLLWVFCELIWNHLHYLHKSPQYFWNPIGIDCHLHLQCLSYVFSHEFSPHIFPQSHLHICQWYMKAYFWSQNNFAQVH